MFIPPFLQLSTDGTWNVDMMQDGSGPHSILCTSQEWLAKHGLEGVLQSATPTGHPYNGLLTCPTPPAEKLSLYQVLGPNAYSRLEGHVQSLHKKVTSRVYDVSFIGIVRVYMSGVKANDLNEYNLYQS